MSINKQEFKGLVKKIFALEEERAGIASDIKEEVKSFCDANEESGIKPGDVKYAVAKYKQYLKAQEKENSNQGSEENMGDILFELLTE